MECISLWIETEAALMQDRDSLSLYTRRCKQITSKTDQYL